MNQRIVVAGTDTEIGKTVFSAGLAALLGANQRSRDSRFIERPRFFFLCA